jgi:hypothetical protein
VLGRRRRRRRGSEWGEPDDEAAAVAAGGMLTSPLRGRWRRARGGVGCKETEPLLRRTRTGKWTLPAVETHGHGTTWHVPRGSSAGAGESTEMRCNQDNAFYGAPTNRPPPANRASGDSAVRRRTGSHLVHAIKKKRLPVTHMQWKSFHILVCHALKIR